jgi:hypothetical protein
MKLMWRLDGRILRGRGQFWEGADTNRYLELVKREGGREAIGRGVKYSLTILISAAQVVNSSVQQAKRLERRRKCAESSLQLHR